MSKRLYLVRHGETGAGGKMVGSSDIDLHVSAYAQLDETRKILENIQFDRVFSSPLKRCLKTSQRLGYGEKAEVVQDLREIDFGEWEMKSFSDIAQSSRPLVDRWSEWSEDFSFPGGEKIGDFLQRISSVKRLIDHCEGDTLLAITHGGVIRQLICSYLGFHPKNYLLFNIAPGKTTLLSLYSEGGVLNGLNIS